MNPYRSRRRGRAGRARRGFTLIELLVVVLIVVIVGAATIKVAIFDQGGRHVSEAARIIQAVIVGTRDAAYRSNSPHGVRLLPDPNFNGQNGGALAANRMIAIESAPDYNSGLVTVLPPGTIPGVAGATGFLAIQESTFRHPFPPGGVGIIPNEPTSWYWNIRQGDKIRIDDSGRYYTVAGPMQVGAYNNGTTLYNTERYINFGPPGFVANAAGTASVANGMNLMQPYDAVNNSGGTHFPEFLQIVNGQDDDGDGWVDEGFDGIDNDGDGIVDPGYNGIDDDGQNGIDDPGELLLNNGGEYEPEQLIGAEFNSLNIGSETDKRYTIARRPVVSEGAREVMLPTDVVIDLTTWNATGAVKKNTNPPVLQPSLPERSRLPVDPYSHSVDIMLGPDGQVITSSAGQSAGALTGGGMASFPTSNMPFYHFWVCERGDVYDPLFGMTATVTKGTGGTNVTVATLQVPISNPKYLNTPPQTYLLPMPQGTVGTYISPSNGTTSAVPYTPPNANGPYLTGEIRLVTLFVRTGQVLTYDVGVSEFDPTDPGQPFMQTRFGTREAK